MGRTVRIAGLVAVFGVCSLLIGSVLPAAAAGVLNIGVAADPESILRPFSHSCSAHEIQLLLFLDLVGVDEDLVTPTPELARSWEKSPDGLTITFHLDSRARWHDGAPVTADDVVFSHEVVTHPEAGSKATAAKKHIRAVEKLDSLTVRFHYAKRTPFQMQDAAAGGVLPFHLLKDVAPGRIASSDYAQAPIGTGAFRFVRWEAGRFLELEADSDHFLGAPKLERVRFTVVPEPTTLLTMLEAGDIDVVSKVPPEHVKRLRANETIELVPTPGRNYYYIAWNLTNPLFASVSTRRALQRAIDRDTLIEVLTLGHGRPFLGPIGPHSWAYHPYLVEVAYDPERALEMLEDDGWVDADGDGWLDRDGVDFEFELITNQESAIHRDAVVMIQSQLAKLGIRMTPRTYENSTLIQKVSGRHYEDAAFLATPSRVDPVVDGLFHSRSREGKGYNFTGYSNAVADSLMDLALAQTTRKGAAPYWREVQEILAHEQPFTWLFTMDDVHAIHAYVHGVESDPRSIFFKIKNWWIDPTAN